ncbi:cytochrome b/b6 domain-containing protein [Paracoccus aminophilus]|uniref:Cytochrome b561 n=1 Tax=Paracoccus aminophilus JCM 7686 TaxID=1367847 RepID=S5YVG8_PARAH|nr:cytochrome b/b6 domain-containing protein [Paracoccus aminophilus]AGT09216.1 cytochrome b561 [Paracoccus aminophilus JCM 7686]
MNAKNSPDGYGWVARGFHWIIALLIFTALGLGLYGSSLREGAASNLQKIFQVFSIHKTVGIAVLILALLRILWMLGQKKPRPLHPERKLETWLGEFVHWGLYTGMVVMPLSGWLIHSAAPGGFARILWPFGQRLPFIPENAELSERFATFHNTGWWLLVGLLVLHVAGALKHALIDRDETLVRMTRTMPQVSVEAAQPRSHLSNLLVALAFWAAIAVVAMVVTPEKEPQGGPEGIASTSAPAGSGAALASATPAEAAPAAAPETAPAAASASGTAPDYATTSDSGTASGYASDPDPSKPAPLWQVESGTLGISVKQAGAEVAGQFANWTAKIAYDPASQTGHVSVTIDTGSLTLGAVSDTAKGPEFLNTTQFPKATFEANLRPEDSAGWPHLAKGDLTIAGKTVIAELPFDVVVKGDKANASGSMTVDRRDFELGKTYGDESTVAFPVTISFDLDAKRQ